ncbi:hypothetical protein EMPG_11710 [Blastomyces silverae]|uniref:Uncharacterized protein n=1 Tax=Blastomyces silverae TaxID=2060906 RepID=A0A0H1BWA4_9EURO|nr:hypothetical protein EMPG_11710 [Blastomyces silverae]
MSITKTECLAVDVGKYQEMSAKKPGSIKSCKQLNLNHLNPTISLDNSRKITLMPWQVQGVNFILSRENREIDSSRFGELLNHLMIQHITRNSWFGKKIIIFRREARHRGLCGRSMSLSAEVVNHLKQAQQHLLAILPQELLRESSKRPAVYSLPEEQEQNKRPRTDTPKPTPSSSNALEILRNRSKIPSTDGPGERLPATQAMEVIQNAKKQPNPPILEDVQFLEGRILAANLDVAN